MSQVPVPEILSGQPPTHSQTPPTSTLIPTSPTVISNVAEPGWTTTEFWVTTFANVTSFLVAFNIVHFTSDQTQTVAGLSTMAATNVAYAISRGLRKNGTTA